MGEHRKNGYCLFPNDLQLVVPPVDGTKMVAKPATLPSQRAGEKEEFWRME
jgi:hypothetical protein